MNDAVSQTGSSTRQASRRPWYLFNLRMLTLLLVGWVILDRLLAWNPLLTVLLALATVVTWITFRCGEAAVGLWRWPTRHWRWRAIKVLAIAGCVVAMMGPVWLTGYIGSFWPRYAVMQDLDPNQDRRNPVFHFEPIEATDPWSLVRRGLHWSVNSFYSRTVAGDQVTLTLRTNDVGLRRAARVFPDAIRVWVVGGEVTDAGVLHLGRLRRLQYLALDGTNVGDDGISMVRNFPHLVALGLSKTRITDDGLGAIANLPNLEYLRLNETAVTDEGLRKLSRCGQLKELVLRETRITGEGLNGFAKQGVLQQLTLSKTSLSPEGWRNIGRIASLTRLDLDDVACDVAACQEIAQLPNISELLLMNCSVTDAGVEQFGSLPVTMLHLHGNPVSDACLPHLAKLPLLEGVNLGDTNIQGEGIACLAKSKSLHMIVLPITDLNADIAAELSQLQQLQTIYAPQLSPAHGQALRKQLPRCEIVTK